LENLFNFAIAEFIRVLKPKCAKRKKLKSAIINSAPLKRKLNVIPEPGVNPKELKTKTWPASRLPNFAGKGNK